MHRCKRSYSICYTWFLSPACTYLHTNTIYLLGAHIPMCIRMGECILCWMYHFSMELAWYGWCLWYHRMFVCCVCVCLYSHISAYNYDNFFCFVVVFFCLNRICICVVCAGLSVVCVRARGNRYDIYVKCILFISEKSVACTFLFNIIFKIHNIHTYIGWCAA